MKRLSLLLLTFMLLASRANAATLSGNVISLSTGLPVSGQKIYYFSAANFKLIDSTTTNTSGTYSFTIPASIPSFDSFKVYTYACGAQTYKWIGYLGSNVTANLSICTPAPATATLHGTVNLSGIANNGVAKLWLIRKQYDSTTVDTILTAIDSFNTASTGGVYSVTYSSMPSGTLLLKAALTASHPQYNNYLPTYFDSSLVWSGATALTPNNFVSTTSTNIRMTAGTNLGGPGFVSGSVLAGAGKGTAVGDPLPGRILLLTTSAGAPVAYTYSNSTGQFSFSNLALNTYKIFGDVWGKLNPALTFTLTQIRPGATNIIFEEKSKKFEGRFGPAAVSSPALEGVSVYPNPVGNLLSLAGLSSIGGAKMAVLRDVTGRELLRQTFANGQVIEMATGSLATGIYLLQLHTDAGSASFRVVK